MLLTNVALARGEQEIAGCGHRHKPDGASVASAEGVTRAAWRDVRVDGDGGCRHGIDDDVRRHHRVDGDGGDTHQVVGADRAEKKPGRGSITPRMP